MSATNDILIAVPTFESIEPEVFKAIYDLNVPHGHSVDFTYVKGYDCARARNEIAKLAIEEDYNYILMVDSDTVIPPHTLEMFFDQEPPEVLLGIYPRKNLHRKAEIFSMSADRFSTANLYGYNELEQMRDLHGARRVQVRGGGLGCALIRTDVFKKILMPYFLYVCYPNGNVLSEDLYFCGKVTDAGGSIFVDTRVWCGHVAKTTKYE